jgi:hypothetical protein
MHCDVFVRTKPPLNAPMAPPCLLRKTQKTVLAAESEGEGRRTVSAFRPRPLRYLPSLDASLMARLDRLGPAGAGRSAIGRRFPTRSWPRSPARRNPVLQYDLTLSRAL